MEQTPMDEDTMGTTRQRRSTFGRACAAVALAAISVAVLSAPASASVDGKVGEHEHDSADSCEPQDDSSRAGIPELFKTVTRRDQADGSVTVTVRLVGPAGLTATTVHDCTWVDGSGNAARDDHERSLKTATDVVFAPAADGTSVVEFLYTVPAAMKAIRHPLCDQVRLGGSATDDDSAEGSDRRVLLSNVACATTLEPVVPEAPIVPLLGASGAVMLAIVSWRRRGARPVATVG
jgi:hypothetical protein